MVFFDWNPLGLSFHACGLIWHHGCILWKIVAKESHLTVKLGGDDVQAAEHGYYVGEHEALDDLGKHCKVNE